MSNEMRGEDTILGTALARAIESQPIRSTAFERSRVVARMAGGGRSPLVPVLAAAAAVVLGLALGAALLGQRGPTDPGGVATQPTATPGTTASPAGTGSPDPTRTPSEDLVVFLALDQLPPVAIKLPSPSTDDKSPETLIRRRLVALASTDGISGGPINALSQIKTSSGSREIVSAVTIEGDLARVEFDISDWGARGAAMSQALLQQLVYTITEEPGIRRAMIAEKGRSEATIDQLVVDKPLTREDVLPYEGVKTEERVALEDDPRGATATTRIEDIVGGIRFVIELKATETPAEGFWTPNVGVDMGRGDPPYGPGKASINIALVAVSDARSQGGASVVEKVERSPLRAVQVTTSSGITTQGTVYNLALDDARPWRVSLEPGAERGTMRLIVDIGGHPQAISNSVAVYGPKPGDQVSRTFTLIGTARVFEAHVAWRVKDASQKEVATGFATASLGTSPVWGTFTTEVKVPDNVSGVVTLEVFWPSPRDGADVDTVAIPLQVR
jgi:hypothetical protein